MAASSTCMAVNCGGVAEGRTAAAGVETRQRSAASVGFLRSSNLASFGHHGGSTEGTRKTLLTRRLQVSAAKQRNISKDKAPAAVAPPAVETPVVEDLSYRPKLPGDEPDMFEGPDWDWLGVLVEYLWAVGIVVAILACLFAVRGYNDGAVDFRETAEYKASLGGEDLSNLSPSDALLLDAPALLDN